MHNPFEEITLESDGARAEIYPYGAHVTAWQPAEKAERLFLSEKAEFRPGAAMRGGVPVVFPQFSGFGLLPKHGFARNLPWEVQEVTSDRLILQLSDTPDTRQLWDYPFLLRLRVKIAGQALNVRLSVENTGEQAFTFTGALHTYLRVNDLADVEIDGLNGRLYRDYTDGGTEKFADKANLRFNQETDRLYPGVTHPIVVREPGQVTRITSSGFPDVVIWNPGAEKSAALADMEPDGYQRFVCVEAAAAASPINVAPGETWNGEQSLTVVE